MVEIARLWYGMMAMDMVKALYFLPFDLIICFICLSYNIEEDCIITTECYVSSY